MEETEDVDESLYRSLIGQILFASNVARYDIAYIVGVLSRHLNKPKKVHMNAAKKVLRYLNSTKQFAITYKSSQQGLIGYCDSDYANELESRRSTTGFIFGFAGGVISWRSKLQSTVALSSTEAEFMAITEITREGLWLLQVLQGLGLTIGQFLVKCDNQGAIKLVKHPVFHHRTKHIDVRLMFVRSHLENKKMLIEYTATEEQKADMLTKALSKNIFTKLRDKAF